MLLSANIELYKELVKELAQVLERQFAGNVESRAAGMVVNTMGWIEGVGYEVFTSNIFSLCLWCHNRFFVSFLTILSSWQLLKHAIDTFNATVVLVLGQVAFLSGLSMAS